MLTFAINCYVCTIVCCKIMFDIHQKDNISYTDNRKSALTMPNPLQGGDEKPRDKGVGNKTQITRETKDC